MAEIVSLSEFRRNEMSQYGEDGIIKEIFLRIGISSRFCFEAGAWNGFHFSNTAKLWNEQEWSAILVEKDASRAAECIDNTSSVKHNRVVVLNQEISHSNGIDSILQRYSHGELLDFLSLDIDGNEWHVLNAMRHMPRVICVEYNPTMPPHIEMVGSIDRGIGASLQAFKSLLWPTYTLVYATEVNAFLVLSQYSHLFRAFDPVEVVRYNMLDYMISDYAGRRMKYWANAYGRQDDLLPSFFTRIEQ